MKVTKKKTLSLVLSTFRCPSHRALCTVHYLVSFRSAGLVHFMKKKSIWSAKVSLCFPTKTLFHDRKSPLNSGYLPTWTFALTHSQTGFLESANLFGSYCVLWNTYQLDVFWRCTESYVRDSARRVSRTRGRAIKAE